MTTIPPTTPAASKSLQYKLLGLECSSSSSSSSSSSPSSSDTDEPIIKSVVRGKVRPPPTPTRAPPAKRSTSRGGNMEVDGFASNFSRSRRYDSVQLTTSGIITRLKAQWEFAVIPSSTKTVYTMTEAEFPNVTMPGFTNIQSLKGDLFWNPVEKVLHDNNIYLNGGPSHCLFFSHMTMKDSPVFSSHTLADTDFPFHMDFTFPLVIVPAGDCHSVRLTMYRDRHALTSFEANNDQMFLLHGSDFYSPSSKCGLNFRFMKEKSGRGLTNIWKAFMFFRTESCEVHDLLDMSQASLHTDDEVQVHALARELNDSISK